MNRATPPGDRGRLQLVVMAAGIGSRFGGLKQLAPVGPAGETLLDYAVHDAWRAGIRRLVFVIRPEIGPEFDRAVASRYTRLAEVRIVHQRPDDLPEGLEPPPGRGKPWGTGHAVLAARTAVDAPFVVANADDLYGPQGFDRLAGLLAEGTTAGPDTYGLVAYRLERTLSAFGSVSRGVCEIDGDGFLADIVECTGIRADADGIVGRGGDGQQRRFAGSEPVSMNLWGFRPGVFAGLAAGFARFLAARRTDPTAEFYLPAAVAELMRAGAARVRVLSTPDPWLGITVPDDLAAVRGRLRGLLAAGIYPDPLWGGRG